MNIIVVVTNCQVLQISHAKLYHLYVFPEERGIDL